MAKLEESFEELRIEPVEFVDLDTRPDDHMMTSRR
jgi:hypothetical protein